MTVKELCTGAIDLHEHLGPSVIPRRLNAIEGAREAREAGFRGILIKDHQFPSMASAELTRFALGNDPGFFVGSSIALNHEMGGLNVAAVETAINMGVNMVYFPTISTQNHHDAHQRSGLVFPASKKKIATLPRPYLPILDEKQQLTDDCKRVLDIVAKDSQVILGTGHGYYTEVDAIIRGALAAGVKKIVVNHPNYMVDAPLELMQDWAAKGVFLEFGACTCDPQSFCFHMAVADTVGLMKAIGVEHLTLASDYGQKGNPAPVEGIYHFVQLLLDAGFTEADIEIMLKRNPARLIGLDGQ